MSSRHPLPPGPKGWPLLGCVPQVLRDPLAFICELANGHGPIASARIGPVPVYFVSDPALLEELFLGHHSDHMKERNTRALKAMLGQGLFTSEGDLWRRQRKLASPPLQPKRLDNYAKDMVAITERFMAEFSDDEVRDLHNDMMGLTLEITGKCLLGFDTRNDSERVRHALHDAMSYFTGRFTSLQGALPVGFPTPALGRFRRARRELDEIVHRIIDSSRKEGNSDDHLLARLLNARTETGESMSDEQARDEAITVLLAGHETTALALTYALYLLQSQPETEARVREELAQLGDALPRTSDLARMPYLDAVVRETLRLYPPVWAIGREVTSPFELGGYHIPKGAQVMTSAYGVQRNPELYPEPDSFRPERWLDGKLANLSRYSYFPFGMGPRICIGAHFAKLELLLVLATMLQHVKLTVTPGYEFKLDLAVTMRIKNGMPMSVQRLRSNEVRDIEAPRPASPFHAESA